MRQPFGAAGYIASATVQYVVLSSSSDGSPAVSITVIMICSWWYASVLFTQYVLNAFDALSLNRSLCAHNSAVMLPVMHD